MANRNRLQCVIDDLEALQAEKAEIDERIKERKKEAKADGFSVKTIDTVLKRRKKKPEVVAEEDELIDLYEANIEGRELGSAGRRRLERTRQEEQPDLFTGDDDGDDDAGDGAATVADGADDSEEVARAKGAAAAAAGQKVTSNPYAAGSAQRGWWDDAWCAASGSDGMDIPDAFKPTPKPKKEKPAKGGAPKSDDGEGGGE